MEKNRKSKNRVEGFSFHKSINTQLSTEGSLLLSSLFFCVSFCFALHHFLPLRLRLPPPPFSTPLSLSKSPLSHFHQQHVPFNLHVRISLIDSFFFLTLNQVNMKDQSTFCCRSNE
ncbi:hypothetical protein Droror1_Dr00025646 [Drosera rotundifolia]